MKKQNVCNNDCFHCVYEDCICDEMDAQDYRYAREIEEILQPKTLRQKKIAAKKREYYEQNKEAIAAKQREYYTQNKEAIAAKQREYREQNKEAIAAYKREYYTQNKEAIAAKQREYREQNKEAIAAKQRGKALRQFRMDHGYTQMAFAKWIGISQSLVSLYESGAVPYDPAVILRRFPEFRAYMESAACGEEAPQTACENNTSAL